MQTKELIEYLQRFDAESEVVVIAVSLEKRKKYDGGLIAITDEEQPIFVLDIKGESDLDEEETEAAEQDERKAEQE